MYNIIAMDHPSLKPNNSILFKSSFLRTVLYDMTYFLTAIG